MPRFPRLTEFDRKFLEMAKMNVPDPRDEVLAGALMDHMGKPRQEDQELRLSAQNAGLKSVNADLRLSLRHMASERDLFRRRFLLALTVAVGTWVGIAITVAITWWLRAGLR